MDLIFLFYMTGVNRINKYMINECHIHIHETLLESGVALV